LSQKKSKSRKMNRKMSKTARTRKKLPRAIALGISEPKLRGQRSGNVVALAREDRPLRAVEDRTPSPLPLSEIMLCWSPWNVMLRQQAFVAQALSNIMRAQQQFARMLS
jgi:hypothetical protein